MTLMTPSLGRKLMVYTGLSTILALSTVALPIAANAQSVERHLPQAPQTPSSSLQLPTASPSNGDATPIGPALRTIVLLDTASAVKPVDAGTQDGIDIQSLQRLQDDSAIKSDLKGFMGQPISRKLITKIESALAARYRQLNHPFVALSLPEQEISSGVLQIRVIEFHVGTAKVEGASAADAGCIAARAELKPGETIDSHSLDLNLTWLNRYPFRNVNAVFRPGAALGETDELMSVQYSKPWSVYGGYSNTGSPSTGLDRYFLGGSVGGVLGHDSVLSYQLTGSKNAVSTNPTYRSDALDYVLPTFANQELEVELSRVESNQTTTVFGARLKDVRGSIGYRFALPQASGLSDLRFGVEGDHQVGVTLFGGIPIYETRFDSYQVFAGFHSYHTTGSASSDLDVVLHISPGDLTAANSDARAVLYSQGRMKSARYAFLTLAYTNMLPVAADFRLETQVFGQIATTALPRSEQAGLGNRWLVRGYSYDDGGFDTSIVMRNTLHASPLTIAPRLQIAPYAFVDFGQGHDIATDKYQSLASTGIGFDLPLTRRASLNIEGAYRLKNTPETKKGAFLGSELAFRF